MLLRWDGCGWNRNNGMPTQAKRSKSGSMNPRDFSRGENQARKARITGLGQLLLRTAFVAEGRMRRQGSAAIGAEFPGSHLWRWR
jgi:hypothetical protein